MYFYTVLYDIRSFSFYKLFYIGYYIVLFVFFYTLSKHIADIVTVFVLLAKFTLLKLASSSFFFFSFVYLLLDHYKRIHNFTIIIFLKISLILCVNSEYLIRFSFFFFNNFHSDTIVILKLFLLRTYKFFVNNFVILNFLCYPIANYLSIG